MRLVSRLRPLPVLVCVLATLIASPAWAQRITGQVEGLVTDPDGSPLPGVVVVVRNVDTGLERTITTASNGRYVVRLLPIEGLYEIRAAMTGFRTVVNSDLQLDPNQVRVIDFEMELSAVEEVIQVSGAAPIVDTVDSTIQQSVTEEMVRTLPQEGRNFLHLSSLAAGFVGNASFPSTNGQNYYAMNILVDGSSHFSKWRSAARTFHAGYGLESVKEVQVLTNRFSAEFGDAMSTVTSAITKSGTNRFQGSVFGYFQNDSLNALPEFASEKPPLSFQQFGAAVGGPIARDRTHFFASYEGRRDRSSAVVTSPAQFGAVARNDQDEHIMFAKIDHQAGDSHRITAKINSQFFDWTNAGGGLTLPGNGDFYENDVHTIQVSDTFVGSDRLLSETRAQYAYYYDLRTDLNSAPYTSRAGYSTEGGFYGPTGFGAKPENTWEIANTTSMWSERHTMRFGGGFRYVTATNPQAFFGGGAYFFAGAPDVAPDPFLFQQALAINPGSDIAEPRSVSGSLFFQDDWRVGDQFTLNLGVRYDVDSPYNIVNYDAPVDWNNIQPRLGFTWDLRGDGRTAIRGGGGLYTQQHLFYHLNRAELEGPDGVATIALFPGDPLFPTYPNVLPEFPPGAVLPPRNIRAVSNSLVNPFTLQASVGISHAFSRNFSASADYIHMRGYDLYGAIDANAPARYEPGETRTVAEADATRPLTPAPNGFRNILTLTNQGESWYNAFQFKTQFRTQRLSFMTSYTFSKAEDMLNPWSAPQDSRNIEDDRAPANADARHNFVAAVTWHLPGEGLLGEGWMLSSVVSLRSATPYTAVWGDDRTGTGLNNARPGPRNGERGDTYKNVDLAVSKTTPIGASQLELRADFFNIFNIVNYTFFGNVVTSPTFGQPLAAAAKRRVQLAAVVRF